MTAAVISVDRRQHELAGRLLPHAVHEITLGGDRAYLLYRVPGRSRDESFVDPSDGVLLVEYRFFDDESDARRWILADIQWRAARTEGVQ